METRSTLENILLPSISLSSRESVKPDNSNSLADNTVLDNIYKILLKTTDSINKLHTLENEKESFLKLTSLIEKKFNNHISPDTPRKQLNLLDWSMQDPHNNASIEAAGRPSLLVKQSVDDDVLKILKNSDETTWFTLDLILKKLNDHTQKLDLLLHSNNDDDDIINTTVRETNFISPLVEAIRNTANESSNQNNDEIFNETITKNNSIIEIDNNSIHTMSPKQKRSSSSATGEPVAMDKRKEAMAQTNHQKIVPETLKQTQKRQNTPSLSGNGPLGSEISRENNESTALKAMESLDITDTSFKSIVIESIHDLSGSEHDSVIYTSNIEQNVEKDDIKATENELIPTPSTDIFKEPSKPSNCPLHLSNLPTNITELDIINYVKLKGISNTDDIKLTKLVKSDADLSLLTFISFKIDTSETIYQLIRNDAFWPNGCKVKDFVPKTRISVQKKISIASIENFLSIGQARRVGS